MSFATSTHPLTAFAFPPRYAEVLRKVLTEGLGVAQAWGKRAKRVVFNPFQNSSIAGTVGVANDIKRSHVFNMYIPARLSEKWKNYPVQKFYFPQNKNKKNHWWQNGFANFQNNLLFTNAL